MVAYVSSFMSGMISKNLGFIPEADQLPLYGLLNTPSGARNDTGWTLVPYTELTRSPSGI